MEPNQQNRSQGQRTQGKPHTTPKKEIKTTLGDIDCTNGFSIPIEIRVVRGSNAMANERIRVKKGITDVAGANLTTDANGEVLYTHKEPAASAGKSIVLRFLLTGVDGAEATVTVSLPEEVKQSASKNNDPQRINLSRYRVANGNFALCVRVTKAGGAGVAVPVVLEFEGQQTTVQTDSQGNASMALTQKPTPTHPIQIKAIVSGIEQPAKLTLRSRRVRTRNNRANNRRARWFLGIAAVLLIACFISGWGEPIFSSTRVELTEQQKMYNTIVSGIDDNLIVKEVADERGDWQKKLWFISLAWTIFALIYAPFSLREEIADTARDWFEDFLERRSSAYSSDPLFERIAGWAGTMGTAQAKVHISGGGAEEAPKQKGHLGFWDVFKSDMLSEILVGLIPTLFRRVVLH